MMFGLFVDFIYLFISIIPIILILNFTLYRNYKFRYKIILFIYVIYLSFLFLVVGLPTMMDFNFDCSINIIPFTFLANDIKNFILNIILFIPFGFFLSAILGKDLKISKCILYGFLCSFFIEILQLFTFRTTDIDDLISNTLGTFIGNLICLKIGKFNMIKGRKFDVIMLFAIVFLVYYFFFLSFIYK